MISLRQNTLLREIPVNLLVDEKVSNLAKALQVPISEMLDWAEKINYKMNLESLDESIIDHLLWESHITWNEGLNLATTKEQKIQLIKSSIELHRLKGTPAAIEKALETLRLPGEVVEWFEYGGNPYHFKVQINLDEYFSRDFDINQLRRLINANKNVRSWLEVINLKGYILIPQIFKHNNFIRIQINTSSNPWAFAGATGIGVEKVTIDGKYNLNGERYLNSFIKTNGPAYISDTRLVVKVLHDFGIHEVSITPILDGEHRLDGQILLQNDVQKVKLAVLQEAKLREKLRPKIAVASTAAIAAKSKIKTTSNPWAFAGGGFGSESIRLDGNYSLNADRFLNGYYNVDGPVYSARKRFTVKVVHDFGVHEVNVLPMLDGSHWLDGEVSLQNEIQLVKVAANQSTAMRFKEREVITLAPKQELSTLCSLSSLSGISALNGANNLSGVISLNQTLFEHSGLFRVKKSGITVEEVAV